MKTRRHSLAPALLLLCLLLLTGCHHSVEMDPAFIESDALCLKMDGKTVMTYDPLTWQLGYNAAKPEFSVFSDDMSSYYVLSCRSALPVKIGEAVAADLEWTDGSRVKKESDLRFTVKRFGDDGTVWLWCAKKGIGVVVRVLRP